MPGGISLGEAGRSSTVVNSNWPGVFSAIAFMRSSVSSLVECRKAKDRNAWDFLGGD